MFFMKRHPNNLKMGLLSDPDIRTEKWLKKLDTVQGPFSLLCYLGAVVYFLCLAHSDLSIETHFSENALLPGLVRNGFNAESTAKQYYREFTQELKDKYADTDKIPVPWLVAKMSQLHLEVYTHNFTLNYPFGEGQVYRGTNVYGILRGARTASLEAIVISAPYRSLGGHQKGTAAGIALMLAFAQYARPQKYWAKDLIFLITEHEQLGMQAWLEAYHGIHSDSESFYTSLGAFWEPGTSGWDLVQKLKGFGWDSEHVKCLNPGTLVGRSGAIQAAINLEIHTPSIKYLEVKVEGLNGQLPNLDLVNLVHKLGLRAGIHHSFKYSYSWIRIQNKMDQWWNGLWTMLSMVASQVPGVPNGNHGLFHRFGIEALTLEGREVNDPAGDPPRVNALTPANFHRLGVHLENVVRSVNNLLEKFHQSYFFYLLPATNRFVSIGLYIPSLIALCFAMLIRSLRLWLVIIKWDRTTKKSSKKPRLDKEKLSDDENEEKEKLSDDENEEKEKLSDDENEEVSIQKEKQHVEVPGDNKDEESTLRRRKTYKSETNDVETKEETHEKEEDTVRIVALGANYLLMHLLGYAVLKSPVLLTWLGTRLNLNSEVSVFRGLSVISVLLIVITPFLLRIYQGSMSYKEIAFINMLVLIELATVFLTLGMLNFSLGLLLATLYTPLALVVGFVEKGKRSKSLLPKRILCLLLQPLIILTIVMVLYSRVLFPEEDLLQMFSRGTDATMQAIMFSIVDSLIYGNWLYSAITATLLPCWLMLWQILTTPVHAN